VQAVRQSAAGQAEQAILIRVAALMEPSQEAAVVAVKLAEIQARAAMARLLFMYSSNAKVVI